MEREWYVSADTVGGVLAVRLPRDLPPLDRKGVNVLTDALDAIRLGKEPTRWWAERHTVVNEYNFVLEVASKHEDSAVSLVKNARVHVADAIRLGGVFAKAAELLPPLRYDVMKNWKELCRSDE